ncbi:MAG: aminopeptidase P family protein [Deltaproteobacteria bacterium]|nr:aminopeptidase P family protein [Candidatus Anaeroferrophillus wilburensis]MBN2888831.1 aminopeptidase P family protein [Deltaproteobacteria bacterium]
MFSCDSSPTGTGYTTPYHQVPAAEIVDRIARFQTCLAEQGTGGALLLQNTDIFYCTGTLQNGILFIPATGTPTFWVRRSFDRGRQESPLTDIRPQLSLADLVTDIKGRLDGKNALGLELDVLPTRIYRRYADLLAGTPIIDISPLIRQVRALKSTYETGCIRKACRIMSEVFKHAATIIKPGITELELQAELEYQARIRGHLGIARMRGWNNELFFGHVISGPAAAARGYLDAPTNGLGLSPAFPQGATTRTLQPGIPVSIDFMVNADGYLGDETRMFCLGQPAKQLLKTHRDLLTLNRELVQAARPGVVAGSIHDLAVELAEHMGYGNHFLGTGGDRVSFVGHGVGLEVDEFPFMARGSKQILEAGMVIALEPKFIFPDQGVITIENTYLLTGNGNERLTTDGEAMVIV